MLMTATRVGYAWRNFMVPLPSFATSGAVGSLRYAHDASDRDLAAAISSQRLFGIGVLGLGSRAIIQGGLTVQNNKTNVLADGAKFVRQARDVA